jgi:hypothetical protein
MSKREADEMSRHGGVLRWSSDEEDKTQEKIKDISVASDTTASTPECLKSPEITMTRIPGSGSVVTDRIGSQEIQSRRKPSKKDEVQPGIVYAGVKFVPETEQNDGSGDSDDNVPVARLLRPKNKGSLTFQQIKDCKDGPQGDKAIGVTVAKTFDGVEFKGVVDSFRTERKRHIYHVTYTDGDEKELSQKELRDAFVLGLAPEIEAEWK